MTTRRTYLDESRFRRDKYWKTHWRMDVSELIEVTFYTDTNPQFVYDFVFTGSDKPLLRKKQHDEPNIRGPLRVTLLELYQKTRQYGGHKKASGVDVWEMVVMDQSFSMFKLVLNSSIQDIPHKDLHVGSTIIIASDDYSIIRHKVSRDGQQRGVVFITNFDFDPAPQDAPKPVNEQGDASSEVTPDFSSAWISVAAIRKVKAESVLLFMESYQHKEEGFFYWMHMTGDRVIEGDFARNAEDNVTWKQCYYKRRWYETDEPCECVQGPHFLERCIVGVKPVAEVDEEELFHEVKDKLKGRVVSDDFDGLSPSHKRWCLYWHYAINFFHFGGGEAQQLPKCLVAAIRSKHPDPSGKYTGFRTKEERVENADNND